VDATRPTSCDDNDLRRGRQRLSPQLAPQAPKPPTDPDLARLMAAWPDLPPAIRRAVLALLDVAPDK
jgi:hypothetical protein